MHRLYTPRKPPPPDVQSPGVELLMNAQSLRMSSSPQKTPPPLFATPLTRVKPLTVTLLVRKRQRMARPPSMIVAAAPLTLCNVRGLATATRLVESWNHFKPPV